MWDWWGFAFLPLPPRSFADLVQVFWQFANVFTNPVSVVSPWGVLWAGLVLSATASLLEDAVVDLDRWIADEVEAAFAEQEGAAFVNGDGVNKPKGFLAAESVAEASWSWGQLGHLATGEAGAFPASAPSDILIDLIYALKAGYRQNATFVMHSSCRSIRGAQSPTSILPPFPSSARVRRRAGVHRPARPRGLAGWSPTTCCRICPR